MSVDQTPRPRMTSPYEETQFDESQQTVTIDAVAGETALPGLGDGNDGPTGGSPREAEPSLAENDLDDQDVDLDETE